MGVVFTLSHIAFAAAAEQPIRVATGTSLSRSVDTDITGSITPGQELAENCYFEFVQERNALGKTITRRVHECD
jgi:hypothetical protein